MSMLVNIGRKLGASAVALAVAAAIGGAASAQSAMKLRVADSFPVGHPTTEYLTKYFMERVKEESKGQIDFEYYTAQQLGKAQDLLKERGVAFTPLPDDEKQRIRPMLTAVGEEWATAMDGRGKPGSAVLEEFLAALKTETF